MVRRAFRAWYNSVDTDEVIGNDAVRVSQASWFRFTPEASWLSSPSKGLEMAKPTSEAEARTHELWGRTRVRDMPDQRMTALPTVSETDPGPTNTRGTVELRAVSKKFGDTTAVDAIDLHIRSGEFMSILGPSGSGKTTTLRMISGFEAPTKGEVWISGLNATDVPAHRRNVNTVFQSYALFAHLTVAENVAYGPRVKKRDPAEIRERVARALEMVRLPHLADRHPSQLSGGEQQRVALARAIINEPDVLLLDEPLSALDLKLRQAVRIELKNLHDQLGMTFVFVTHDQTEALTMSDRVAVMDGGRILQLGTPAEVYERPNSRFVANFIGETNLLEGRIETVRSGEAHVRLAGGPVVLASGGVGDLRPGAEVTVAIRPERVRMLAQRPSGTVAAGELAGTLISLIYLGDATRATIALPDASEVVAIRYNEEEGHSSGDLRPGDPVLVGWQPGAARLLTE